MKNPFITKAFLYSDRWLKRLVVERTGLQCLCTHFVGKKIGVSGDFDFRPAHYQLLFSYGKKEVVDIVNLLLGATPLAHY